MFSFFVNGEFKGFWSNQIGDMFFSLTCNKLAWSESLTSLCYFPGLLNSELELAEPSLTECRVNKKVMVEVEVESTDESGNPITVTELQESIVLDRIIPAQVFVNNGLMLIPC